ncbi:MAG: hypothetical protein OK474_10510 [Thaumarchaeota archaeon]|nr:hypothetical protein [Nitrososphaerota archaeon]
MLEATFTKKMTVTNRKVASESVALWALGHLPALMAYLLTQL